MISSTVEDLREEREAVDAVISGFEFERFRSETMTSHSRTPREVCERMAKECDLLILLIGTRYGSTIPDLNISVTEREYEVARSADRGKVLLFVKQLAAGGREKAAEEFLQRVTDFTTGLFRATPYTSVDQLRKQVKAALSAWVSERITEAPVTPAVLFGIPSPPDVTRDRTTFWTLLVALLLVPSALRVIAPDAAALIPSTFEIVAASWRSPIIVPAAVATGVRATGAWIVGIVAGLLAATLASLLPRSLRSLVVPVLAVAGFVMFLFGYVVVLRTAGVYAAACLIAAVIADLLLRHTGSIAAHKDIMELGRWRFRQVFFARTTATLFPLALGALFVSELFSDRAIRTHSLAQVYVDGMFSLRMPEAWLAGMSLLLMAGAAYIGMRSLQSWIGWNTVILPTLRPSQAHRDKHSAPPGAV